jgi:Domain of unknown function (DUF5655)
LKAKSPYTVHPSVAYVQAILDNLEPSTGKDAEGWLRLLKAKGPKDETRRRDWLKSQGLGSTQASLLSHRSVGQPANAFADTVEGYLASAERYVEQQYAGKKAHLRPLYEAVLALGLATGKEAKVCPCQTVVPLFRNHVFAQLKAATLGRLDVGLALGDPRKLARPGARLVETGGFAKKDQLTHRIEVRTLGDVDATLKHWLSVAYTRDG